jgi:hypothetical protein
MQLAVALDALAGVSVCVHDCSLRKKVPQRADNPASDGESMLGGNVQGIV